MPDNLQPSIARGISDLKETVYALPFPLREQVVGFARSIGELTPTLAIEADVAVTPEIAHQFVFLAGVKKLHDLVHSSFWTLDNSVSLLANSEVTSVRMGGRDFSKSSEAYQLFRSLLTALDRELAKFEIRDLLNSSQIELLQAISRNGS